MTKRIVGLGVGAVAALIASGALAEEKYGPGVSDTEILLGQTMPYSGPVSAVGTFGRAMDAYFQKINSEGGINGRKIKLLSRKKMQKTRK